MQYIDDLQLEAEVLPLFDYTHNADAQAVLLQLVRQLPASVELIREKQAILQGFLANWSVLETFSYPKIHFQEVRSFLLDVSYGRVSLETNLVKMTAKLLFSEEERYKVRARYVQTVQFLHRLQQHYLLPLSLAEFPRHFHPQLLILIRFTERFSLPDIMQAIQEDAFSAPQMVRLARQLQQLSAEEVTSFWEAFYLAEAYWSLAKGIRQAGFVFPVFEKAAGIYLEDFYHPALAQPVKNTLALGQEERVVVLTGPNMSGKSTLLKAVGLCVYLAHAGIAVPASSCVLPFFSSIMIAVNLRDSLRDGYSHFMAEIQNLKAVLSAAQSTGRTFAIFDELFRGTNVDDALEITRSTINGLIRFPDSWFFVSTHLLQLETQLSPSSSLRTYCIECTLQDGLPVFSYKLQTGWSALKIGRLLFEKEGLHHLLMPAGTP